MLVPLARSPHLKTARPANRWTRIPLAKVSGLWKLDGPGNRDKITVYITLRRSLPPDLDPIKEAA